MLVYMNIIKWQSGFKVMKAPKSDLYVDANINDITFITFIFSYFSSKYKRAKRNPNFYIFMQKPSRFKHFTLFKVSIL